MHIINYLVGAFSLILLISMDAYAADILVPDDYGSIQEAVDAAIDGDNIKIAPGTYQENLVLKNNITLIGLETARTFLDSPDDQPVMSLNGLSNVEIRHLTFIDSVAAIDINLSSNVSILNNVFSLGKTGTAIDIAGDGVSIKIQFNTFYNNATALVRDFDVSTVNQNIFVNNTLAIDSVSDANIDDNCFDTNTDDGAIGTNDISADPLFIDAANDNFHVPIDSGCKTVGEELSANPDVFKGAYGGSSADFTPFPIQGTAVTINGGPPYSADISWSADTSYMLGAYKVFYELDGPVTDSSDVQSVALANTSTVVNLADPAAVNLASVTNMSSFPSNQTLSIDWDGVAKATGFHVSYATSANPGVELGSMDVTKSQVKITGLDNGTEYTVTVNAFYQASYHFAVRGEAGDLQKTLGAITDEISKPIGSQISGPTASINATPEKITPFPDLPDEGCFIATAAYGYYSAPEVQVLRDFRDRVLLKYESGRQFVSWYYANSPKWAATIQERPLLKKTVQILLYPLVAMAYFVVELTWPQKAVWMLFLVCLAFLIRYFMKILMAKGR